MSNFYYECHIFHHPNNMLIKTLHVYIRTHVKYMLTLHTSVRICIHTHVSLHANMYLPAYVQSCTNLFACTHTHVRNTIAHKYLHAYISKCTVCKCYVCAECSLNSRLNPLYSHSNPIITWADSPFNTLT